MVSQSVLFWIEQGCGGAWRSGKSLATLKIKKVVVLTNLMRVMIIQVYISAVTWLTVPENKVADVFWSKMSLSALLVHEHQAPQK